jgi:hypothetical protein
LPPQNIVDSVRGEELFCSIGYDNPDTLLLRWLRACKWDVNAAVQQTIDALTWRHEWGVYALGAKGESELYDDEIRTGKVYFMGRDRVGRPITYVFLKDHIKGQFPTDTTEKLIVLGVETGRKLVKAPIEMITLVVDVAGFGLRNADYHYAKLCIHLLGHYYPESIGLVLIVNASWLFNSCWNIIRPWSNPALQERIHFLKSDAELAEFIEPSALPKRLNGSHPDYEYIPPTTEDENMLVAFRADDQGNKNAQEFHREASRNYLSLTSQWARGDESQHLLAKRTQAAKQLRDAFEKRIPYISTRTHYHRTGDIDEPIFNITYDRLQANNDSQITNF